MEDASCQKQREGVGGEGRESTGINLQSKISPAHVIYSIVGLILMSLIHFDLIFVYGIS